MLGVKSITRGTDSINRALDVYAPQTGTQKHTNTGAARALALDGRTRDHPNTLSKISTQDRTHARATQPSSVPQRSRGGAGCRAHCLPRKSARRYKMYCTVQVQVIPISHNFSHTSEGTSSLTAGCGSVAARGTFCRACLDHGLWRQHRARRRRSWRQRR